MVMHKFGLACDGDTDHKFLHIDHSRILRYLYKKSDVWNDLAHNLILFPILE